MGTLFVQGKYNKNYYYNVFIVSKLFRYLCIFYSPNTMQFLASRKVYLNANSMVENQWVRI